MSSSSTTAASRSPSPSPATPDSSDALEPVVTQEDLTAWCQSLSSNFLAGEESQYFDGDKRESAQMLDLDDLLQDHAYDDSESNARYKSQTRDLPDTSASVSPLAVASAADLSALPRASMLITKPVPPPPTPVRRDPAIIAQRVVYPAKDTCQNLPIIIPSIPEGGTKSRVETQVRLTVDLAHASASSGEPLKYDRVGSWKWLRLPKGTSTKRRNRKEGKVETQAEDTLYLAAEVTCATSPHAPVTCCTSCQAREAKRVARKIAARVRPARSDSEADDEPPTIPGRGKHEDTSNLLQFNCPEVMDFSSGSVILPLRITCYCRHHREKVGFNVHFTMLDNSGRMVGSGTTRPIMITDDHKSTGVNPKSSQCLAVLGQSEWCASPDSATPSAKRKKTKEPTERSKKRSKPYDADRSATGSRNVSDGSMDSPTTPHSTFISRPTSPLRSIASPAFTGEQETTNLLDHSIFQQPPAFSTDAFAPTFDQGAVATTAFDTHLTVSQPLDTQSMSLDQLTSALLPVAPSSPALLALDPSQTLNVPTPSFPFNFFKHDPPTHTVLPPPKIHRLIPSSGPTYGGVEVTVLGSSFHASVQLTCVFGGNVASSTQRWSDNTLVCLLPPSSTPGVVPVWFDGIQKEEDGNPPVLFAYTDETDRALMELALQVVGLKMTGKIEDARNVAMRIVGSTDAPDPANGISPGEPMQLASQMQAAEIRRIFLSRAGNGGDFEALVLNFLSLLDTPVAPLASSVALAVSHASPSGQTLLHLATFMKYPKLVAFLLAHEADVDARDRNGCTPLHFACIVKSADCAQLLLQAGAALDVVDAWGRTAAEISPGFLKLPATANGASQDDTAVEEGWEDESAWGDNDDTEEEVEPRAAKRLRRRSRKVQLRRRKASHAVAPATEKADLNPSLDDKKLALGDEKQALHPFMEALFRTLAQLQHPQGMIANIQNLPPLHLPHIPGMPAWNALPPMPAVFPVIVPIPALSALWGDKRGADAQEQAPGNAQAWKDMLSAQEWRALWEKWLAQSSPSRAQEEAPPAYTPRAAEVKATPEKIAVDVETAVDLKAEEAVTCHNASEDIEGLPKQLVKTHRPARKASRRARAKSDRMLVCFWIPILLIGFAWAFLHFARVAFHASRAVIGYKTGVHV